MRWQLTASRLRTASLLAALVGAGLFVWSMREAGTAAVVNGVGRVGAGIVIVVALGGVRALARTAAWRLCLDAAEPLTFRSMLTAYLAGDAIGNVTPFGLLASEPSKVLMVRGQMSLPALAASLTVENLFYSATVLVMLVTGTAALLLSVALPRPLKVTTLVVLLVTPFVAVATAWIVTTPRRIVSGGIERLVRHGIVPNYLREKLPQIRQTGDRIAGFIVTHPRTVVPLILLEASYHLVAVAEIWFALGLITGVRPHLLAAFVLEAVNRAITIAFQFVPMWLGVDEAGTAVMTTAIGLGSAAGVSLALVRKTRVAIWTVFGLILMMCRGMSVDGATGDAVLPAGFRLIRFGGSR
jgi:hypothetical protein